jgi:hypothetical protein
MGLVLALTVWAARAVCRLVLSEAEPNSAISILVASVQVAMLGIAFGSAPTYKSAKLRAMRRFGSCLDRLGGACGL